MNVQRTIPRIFLIAGVTFRHAFREKLFFAMLLLAFPFAAGSRLLAHVGLGSSEPQFIADLGIGALTLFGAALAIAATAQLFVGELENRSAHTLLSKPTNRTELLLGKFFGVWLLCGIFVGIVAVALGASIVWTTPSAPDETNPHVLSTAAVLGRLGLICGLQWLKLGLLTAMTLLVSSFASSILFAQLVGGLLFLAGQLQYILVEAGRSATSQAQAAVCAVFSWAVPNLQVFNVEGVFARAFPLSNEALLSLGLYGLGYTAVFLALAAIAFRSREL